LRISLQSIEEVRESANIVEVASEFTALRRQGTNYTGLCPYHEEKTPSFSISSEKNFYYCFGCQRGGDAIKLVMELKSFSFTEAVSHLAERFGVELKFEGRSPEEARAVEQRTSRRRSAHKALAAATAYYHKYLLKSPAAEDARRYLKNRGLEYSTIEEFRLGYAPPRGRPGFMRAALNVGLGRGALEAAGLLSPRGGERFVDRVTFPISDRRGRIVGFGARSLGEAKPKYLNSPETEIFNKRSLLYGFPQVAEAVRREKAALVVEGYTDVLMLYQSGIKNAVATLGTATTPGHLKVLGNYADRVYVIFDPDAAGEKAIERILDNEQVVATAATLQLDLRLLRLPQDPADWLLTHPPEEFAELLTGAVPVLEYSIRRIAEHARGSDAIERSRAVPKIKGLIQKIDDPVLYNEALRLATEALGVGPEALEDRRAPAHLARPSLRPSAPPDPLRQAGHDLLAILLARPDLTARVLNEGIEVPTFPDGPVMLETGDFGDETHARIFTLLVEHAGEDLGSLFSDERARPLLDEISALQAVGERLYPSLTSLRAACLRLQLLNRERAKQALKDRGDMDDESWVRLHRRLHQETQALWAAMAEIEAEPSSS
jgi:DNA primase